mgnify:CR=1 FL=1
MSLVLCRHIYDLHEQIAMKGTNIASFRLAVFDSGSKDLKIVFP